MSLFRIENFGEFVGQKLLCVVMEANANRGNLVLSRRAILEREKAEAKERSSSKNWSLGRSGKASSAKSWILEHSWTSAV